MIKDVLKYVLNFFIDLFNSVKFIYQFFTNEKISRLRILFIWSLVAVLPSLFIYITINTWQVHIPGVEAGNSANGSTLINLLVSTSVVPLLFFYTNGLRGYHKMYIYIVESLFSRFEVKPMKDLVEEFGLYEATEKIKTVDISKYITGLLLLEFIIMGWALFSFFIFGGNLTGLGLVGYCADDLLMGAIVFILEGIYFATDGIKTAPSIYQLKSTKSDKEAEAWQESTEQSVN